MCCRKHLMGVNIVTSIWAKIYIKFVRKHYLFQEATVFQELSLMKTVSFVYISFIGFLNTSDQGSPKLPPSANSPWFMNSPSTVIDNCRQRNKCPKRLHWPHDQERVNQNQNAKLTLYGPNLPKSLHLLCVQNSNHPSFH